MSFIPSSSHKTFNNHPQIRVLLWESGSIVEKFQCTVREKNLRLDTLKRLRTFSLYSHHPTTKEVQLSAERDSLGPQFLP